MVGRLPLLLLQFTWVGGPLAVVVFALGMWSVLLCDVWCSRDVAPAGATLVDVGTVVGGGRARLTSAGTRQEQHMPRSTPLEGVDTEHLDPTGHILQHAFEARARPGGPDGEHTRGPQ